MELITIAKTLKTFGLKGEMRCYPLTDTPKLRFHKGHRYFLVNPKTQEVVLEATLKAFRVGEGCFVLSFEEIPDINAAEHYLGLEIDMEKADAPMPKNTYRLADLIGSKTYDENDVLLGEVIDVVSYSPTSNLKIRLKNKTVIYVPFIDAFVPSVEPGKITLHVVPGMLE